MKGKLVNGMGSQSNAVYVDLVVSIEVASPFGIAFQLDCTVA